MTEEKINIRDSSRAFSGYAIIIGLAMMPILYFLSLGPAVWLSRKMGWPTERSLEIIYWPIKWAYYNTFLKELIRWYVDLFA